MSKRIQAPDGSLVDFPDNMDDAAIASVMAKSYGGPKKTSQALGFEKGLLSPFARLEAGVERSLDSVGYPASKLKRMTTIGGRSAGESQNALAERYEKKEADGTRPGTAGEIVGNIVASIPIGLATRNPWAGGAASGAFLSKADNLKDTAIDAGIGAVAGKAGDVALSKLARVAKPIIDPYVKKLADAGVKLTPGQIRGGRALIREDKATSKPVVGDMIREGREAARSTFNISTLDQALAPIRVKVPTGMRSGHEAVAFAQDAVDQAYNKIVPKLAVKPDSQLAGGIQTAARDVPEQVKGEFLKVVQRTFGKTGALNGRGVKDAQAELGRLSSSYSTSSNAYERELGRALGAVKTEFDDMIVRQNPHVGGELKAVNRAFRGLATIETAAAKTVEGDFTPIQLLQATRQADRSRRKSASAGGQAFMQEWAKAGAKVLGGRTPDSGTATRMKSNFIDEIRGGIASMGYKADNALAQLSLVPRPVAVQKVGNALEGARRGSGVVGAALAPKRVEKKPVDRSKRRG